MFPQLLVDALPWWLAAPLVQLGLLAFGMVLDETYVNRATVLTGSLALSVHALVAGDVWLPVGVYLDLGLAIGAYGLYAYVVDAYVPTWFRIAAFFAYSPLSVFLVIVFPDAVFPVALAVAGYVNVQLMDYLRPREPYYFGPGSPDAAAEAAADVDDGTDATADEGEDAGPVGPGDANDPGEFDRPDPEPTAADGGPDERSVLPEFMRRL